MSSLVQFIQASAYFSMETAESGRIIFADGNTSFEIFCKREAYVALRVAFENKLVDKIERSIIEQQIDDCALPAKLSETMERLHVIEDTLEEIYQMIAKDLGELPMDSFSSKNGATPDDTTPLHATGNKTIH